MRVLVLNEHEVESLLTMGECIAVMEEALVSLARGEVHNPLRFPVRAPGASDLLGLMPAFRGGEKPLWGLKEVCVYPGNPARGLETHLGAVLLHDGETGELRAIMNAAAITAIRTAAVSAVATKLLARQDVKTLAILGAGVQARSHLEAMTLVRDFEEVRICSRTRSKSEALVSQWSTGGLTGAAPASRQRPTKIAVAESIEEAVRGADVIVTATGSREPIVRREWIAGGSHINAVGSSIPAARELDSDTVAAASLFVDRRESTIHESGDYLLALKEGAISGPDHIRAELGELLLGQAEGRKSEREITLFKSLGLAVEDLFAASFLYEKAGTSGAGSWIEL